MRGDKVAVTDCECYDQTEVDAVEERPAFYLAKDQRLKCEGTE